MVEPQDDARPIFGAPPVKEAEAILAAVVWGEDVASVVSEDTYSALSGMHVVKNLPIVDDQDFLVTRTYTIPPPPKTFKERVYEAENPLLMLYDEFAEVMPPLSIPLYLSPYIYPPISIPLYLSL